MGKDGKGAASAVIFYSANGSFKAEGKTFLALSQLKKIISIGLHVIDIKLTIGNLIFVVAIQRKWVSSERKVSFEFS